jgi:hypothetical protein
LGVGTPENSIGKTPVKKASRLFSRTEARGVHGKNHRHQDLRPLCGLCDLCAMLFPHCACFSPASPGVHVRSPTIKTSIPLCGLCYVSPLRLFLARKPRCSRKEPHHQDLHSPSVTSVTSVRCFPYQVCFSHGSLRVHRSNSRGSLDKLRHPTFLNAFPNTLTQAR